MDIFYNFAEIRDNDVCNYNHVSSKDEKSTHLVGQNMSLTRKNRGMSFSRIIIKLKISEVVAIKTILDVLFSVCGKSVVIAMNFMNEHLMITKKFTSDSQNSSELES